MALPPTTKARPFEDVTSEVYDLERFIQAIGASDEPIDRADVTYWCDRCVVLDIELKHLAAKYTPSNFEKGTTIASGIVGVAGTIGTVAVSAIGAAAGPAGWALFGLGLAKMAFYDNPRKKAVEKCQRQLARLVNRLNWIDSRLA